MDQFGQTQEEAFRVAYLIAGFIHGTLTPLEQEELDTWVGASDENMLLFEELTDENQVEKTLAWYQQAKTEEALKKTKAKIGIGRSNRNLFGLLFSAAGLLTIAAGLYFLLRSTDNRPLERAAIQQEEDIKPGSNTAVLTLGDGQVIILNNAGPKVLAKEGGAQIISTVNGQIVYKREPSATVDARFNTLKTPKGAQFRVVLPDGSTVWLNALSSLRYPTLFTGNERRVQLTGEAYFEVAKQPGKPFRVTIGDHTIEVLGTRFNVNAYESPRSLLTTLVEGRVQLWAAKHKEPVLLKAGQQAAADQDKVITANLDDPEMTSATAWKNGMFYFLHASIPKVMRQLENWYDIEIAYGRAGDASRGQLEAVHFNGTIERTAPLSQVVKLLSTTGQVNLQLQGRTLIVTPKTAK